MNSSQTDTPRSILIVDDNPVDLRWLSQMLAGRGYKVRAVISGARALESVQAHLPDLILLDILMPRMNGYEVCKHLKADAQTRDIPIIFVSALDETEDKVQAFATGGVDFVTKPFQVEEVLARVETHLALRNLQKDLQKKNTQLEQEIIERKQAEKEIRQRTAQLEALREVGLELTAQLDLDTLLHSIVSRAIGLLGGIAGGLDLYRPERDVLEAVTTVGDAPARVGSIIQRGEGLSGQVWDTGEPLVADNYPRWEGRVTAYEGRPITAVMGVPVRWGEEFLGVLIVEADAPHKFSPADVELLSLFATQAAIAIRNVHLFQAEREQRELAEALEEAAAAVSGTLDLDEVLDHILEQLERVVAGDAFNVMLVEDGIARIVGWRGYKSLDVETQVASFSLPIAEYPMLAKMVETGEPNVILDTVTDPDWVLLEWGGWLRSYIGAPIRVGGVTVGFLNVDGTRPGQFGPADARRLEAFASHAATAIENAQLYEQARRDAATKAVLLQEVNHRVKNNLSAIIGLIHAEKRHAQAKGETTDEAITENQISRIQRLAMVHDLLSESEWSPLSLSELAEQVTHAALQALPSDKCVSVDVLPSPVRVMPKQANSLALVINELVTNTVKYALGEHQTARITVRITLKDDTVLFEFRDDGPGYPEDVLRLERYDVGLYLIQRLVRIDLRGVLTLKNHHGAVTTIRFKMDKKEQDEQAKGSSVDC